MRLRVPYIDRSWSFWFPKQPFLNKNQMARRENNCRWERWLFNMSDHRLGENGPINGCEAWKKWAGRFRRVYDISCSRTCNEYKNTAGCSGLLYDTSCTHSSVQRRPRAQLGWPCRITPMHHIVSLGWEMQMNREKSVRYHNSVRERDDWLSIGLGTNRHQSMEEQHRAKSAHCYVHICVRGGHAVIRCSSSIAAAPTQQCGHDL